MRVQRTRSSPSAHRSPLTRYPLGGRRHLAGALISVSLGAFGCAAQNAILVHVTDETGMAMPGVVVQTAGASEPSDQTGIATFKDLQPGQHWFDATFDAFKSCGPLGLEVSRSTHATLTLVMRVGTIADGVHISGGPGNYSGRGYSELWFKACPGRPGSEEVVPIGQAKP